MYACICAYIMTYCQIDVGAHERSSGNSVRGRPWPWGKLLPLESVGAPLESFSEPKIGAAQVRA